MPRVLIIADLEGVAGVDDPAALIVGGRGYELACKRLTGEVNAAIGGFRTAGYDSFRVSDSHRSGTEDTNLDLATLDQAAEVYTGADAYSETAFADIDLIACVGMHAGAGTSGFIPHTVSVHCDWRYAGRSLNETEIVLALAAEAGIPFGFVSGDDVLCDLLKDSVRTVVTKRALSRTSARSIDATDAENSIRSAALEPAQMPEPLPAGQLELHFKSAWQARAAEHGGARRLSKYGVAIPAPTFREAYARAHELMGPTAEPVLRALRGRAGGSDFLDDVLALVGRSFPEEEAVQARPSLQLLAHTRDAFLRWTDLEAEFPKVLRALILHMLEAYAPAVFRMLGLEGDLQRALADLAPISVELPPDLPPHLGMSRIDAWYIRQRRGLGGGAPDADSLAAYLDSLQQSGRWIHAWLLGEMAHLLGASVPRDRRERPLRGASRIQDLYWLTHLFLLETDYLERPLPAAGWETAVEELFLAVPWVLAGDHRDLAGEIALCLQLAGEQGSAEHGVLLDFIARSQEPDGSLLDGSMGDPPEVYADHATGVALLVQAGAVELAGRAVESPFEPNA